MSGFGARRAFGRALDGARVHYLDKIGGRFAANVPSRVGGSAPAHCTGLGKAMLAAIQG